VKHVIFLVLALVLCIGAGYAVTRRISAKTDLTRSRRIMLAAAVSISLAAAGFFVYLQDYYRADPKAVKYLRSGRGVEVSESGDAYFFDGPGSENAVVFYPGAKVEETAYAPLMFRLAEQGADCFLLKLPFRMAVFRPNAAADIIRSRGSGNDSTNNDNNSDNNNDYDHWYLMGHSLGGIVASEYASKNPGYADGIILLASYPTGPVPGSEALLSIYGSDDGCLSMYEYNESRGFRPMISSEMIIEGGNHAGFGYYGPQEGDGKAGISPYEQQTLTTDRIVKFISHVS